ncbi:MAG: hypothetical protein EOS58_12755 [Mesorhizobium sp.]|uniref:hypothetical protein n=1 Tax=unclassified Mesorhizobium TaxID=325217 RepID=UPI000F762E63|nr:MULTISPECIES: hypothetical protein [unclassified Mesorhizobium]RVD71819.1 hypothetical protein EN751_13320 [Mesorhizobium sp. M4A.F.Ca.ET.029.04.2.1]AZO48682.1 hypothetical protein EJ073_13320 [Mesorhizobium sp. M4B.F.Ca.ET.058.02.1.1]RUX50970.1 hypothetical protein EOA33_07845 [Mesorhizobium sp. M4A.F.Ca.ET.050.02.1.1]RVC45379.1 hypothetical protein EN781_10100 [Mesorhizobium sp. M4A.F.Ca.ET.090.04.2.1]RVC78869.1 hypothetical protein EN745_17685 [Mesorhizobium sp. M4A.F.Ca.ET.022.05.2.1]
MSITSILDDEAVNDRKTALQTGDNVDDALTDTDVADSSQPASFRTCVETNLGLNSALPYRRRRCDRRTAGSPAIFTIISRRLSWRFP